MIGEWVLYTIKCHKWTQIAINLKQKFKSSYDSEYFIMVGNIMGVEDTHSQEMLSSNFRKILEFIVTFWTHCKHKIMGGLTCLD